MRPAGEGARRVWWRWVIRDSSMLRVSSARGTAVDASSTAPWVLGTHTHTDQDINGAKPKERPSESPHSVTRGDTRGEVTGEEGGVYMPDATLCGVPAVLAAFSACALLLSCAAGKSQGAPSGPPGRVEVRHDAAVFTASILLNLTGYDEENDESCHPVRERIRQQMAEELPAELTAELKEFRSDHSTHFMAYIQFALSTEGPPSFTLRDVDEVAPKDGAIGARLHEVWHSHVTSVRKDLAGLELLLKKIWEVPAVPRAFRDVEQETVQYGMPSAAALDHAIEAAIAYLKADPSHLQLRQMIIPNLLMARGALGVPMGEDTFFTVESPTSGRLGPAGSDPSGDPHEFVHVLVAPATRERSLVKTYPTRFGGLFRRAMMDPHVAGNYNSHEDWVDECMVKAVACRIVYDTGRPLAPVGDPACPLAVMEASCGFLLEAWFYEKLAEYEQGNMSFTEWYEQTVEHTTEDAVLAHLEELGVVVKEP
jgi:hypothetical protein